MSSEIVQRYADYIGDSEFVKEIHSDIIVQNKGKYRDETPYFSETPKYLNALLRPYQIKGLNWLIKRYENKINCILADEMGLGKTLETISFIGYIVFEKKDKGPIIIIVPKSCLQNWKAEFENFLPGISTEFLYCSKIDLKKCWKNILKKKESIVLTTYEMIMNSSKMMNRIEWNYIIVDEAHRLKNTNSKLTITLRKVSTKHILLLTGTPLQNNIRELWALLNFIAPDFFYYASKFENYVKKVGNNPEKIQKLRKILQLFFLRREKVEVEHSLKEKKIVDLYCPMVEMQKKWYKSLLKRDLSQLKLGKNGNVSLLNIIMQLKKCCNHPYLFDGAESEPYEIGEHIVKNSGKMIVLDNLLSRLKMSSSRVLIFSQMANMIDIIEDYLEYRGYKFCRIDGKTSVETRGDMINDFNREDSDKFIFLLTTRAGGVGINLYTANSVIIFDSDWNPQADLQAQDRAHRIGQKKQVNVFRLISENTIEEGIFFRAQIKLRLDSTLIGGRNVLIGANYTPKELIDILATGIEEMGETGDAILPIDDIIKKGEKKSEIMEDKLKKYNICDEIGSKIDVYQWEDEDYMKEKIIRYLVKDDEMSFEIRKRRCCIENVSEASEKKIPRYCMCPKEYYELEEKKRKLYTKNKVLNETEKKKMDELVKKGFDVKKRDYKRILRLLEKSELDVESVAMEVGDELGIDVRKYCKEILERYGELSESKRIIRMIKRNEKKNIRCREDVIEDGLERKIVRLYLKYMDTQDCYLRIKMHILGEEDFQMDYGMLSLSVEDIRRMVVKFVGKTDVEDKRCIQIKIK